MSGSDSVAENGSARGPGARGPGARGPGARGPGEAIAAAMRGRATRSGWIWATLGGLVTISLVVVMWNNVDRAQVLAAFGRISFLDVIAALCMLAAAFTAKIARWRSMLLGLDAAAGVSGAGEATRDVPAVDPGFVVHAETFLAGIALNNVLPLRAGDVARVFGFQAQLGAAASPAAMLGILVVERVLDLIVLLALLAGLAGLLPAGTLPPSLSMPLAMGVATVAGIGLAVVAFARRLVDLIALIEPRLPNPLVKAVLGMARTTLGAIARQTSGTQVLRLVGLTMLAWLLEGGLYVVTAGAIGVAEPLRAGYFAFALATLSTLIPSSPGYFGTFHVFAMLALGMFGASNADAAAFAIVAHLLLWLPVTLAGGAALLALSARATTLPEPAAISTGRP